MHMQYGFEQSTEEIGNALFVSSYANFNNEQQHPTGTDVAPLQVYTYLCVSSSCAGGNVRMYIQ